MKLLEFKLERTMSLYQHEVLYDLTESGVYPLFPHEFVDKATWDEYYQSLQLRYVHTAGTATLKEKIVSFYSGAQPENIFVTNGSAEAQTALISSMMEPGDEIVYITPNYMLIAGLAESYGVSVKEVPLRAENNWQLDIRDLEAAVTPRTKMICVCNPNNPTGTVLSAGSMEEMVRIAKGADAWLLSDEIYRGAEHNSVLTESFWGMYDKVIVTCGLSKAFALPGLRMGWIVAPETLVNDVWPYHDYMTICVGTLNDRLSTIALDPGVREKIFARNRAMAKKNLRTISKWVEEHGDVLSFIPPQAGSFAFVKYKLDISSRELVDRMMKEESVFVVPGDCFGLENHLRISFGSEEDFLVEGLARVGRVIERLK